MSDVTQTPAKRQAIADRQWVDSDGNETSDETKATGFSYVWKSADKYGGVVPEGSRRKFTYQMGNPGDPVTMLAIFGGLTKAGNIANTWTGLPANERGTDPIDDIDEWFKALDAGKWGEERAGGVGARFDKAKLAQALAQATKRDVAEFAAKLDANAKVTDGGREILYGTWALRNKTVKDIYDTLVPPTNAPDLSAL